MFEEGGDGRFDAVVGGVVALWPNDLSATGVDVKLTQFALGELAVAHTAGGLRVAVEVVAGAFDAGGGLGGAYFLAGFPGPAFTFDGYGGAGHGHRVGHVVAERA